VLHHIDFRQVDVSEIVFNRIVALRFDAICGRGWIFGWLVGLE